MSNYYFTKEQAEAAARAMIINYFELTPTPWQEETTVAYSLTGLLNCPINTTYAGAALEALESLAKVEDGTHPLLELNAAGTVDNRAEITERMEQDFTTAVRDTIAAFVPHEVYTPEAVAA
ncbi:hypothetical protein [Pseudarthrobacter sp. PS3-L1]|uniref:hypothetical protein n=1 Tax=Pseudarthrobacter sp. PS3-L1 TaxID=3046207 RepID=UPI0024BA2FF3|nr:hypothetical protein [Pseudarthrobacter sp. PS3-L1]MDJ0319787.1 hypothetical protein [Pseudarthrobacter sp. PS3-L1]